MGKDGAARNFEKIEYGRDDDQCGAVRYGAVNKRACMPLLARGYGIIDLRLYRRFMAADNAFGMRLTAETEPPARPRPTGDFV